MAQAPETDHPQAEQISFELERLTLSAEDRLELTGRWFGVRGRRFVRPTLMLIGEHNRSRSVEARDHAMTERDQAVEARDRARTERDRAVSARDRTRAERVIPPAPRTAIAALEHRPRVPDSRHDRRAIVWATRLFALVVLLAAVAAITIIIRSA